MSEQKWTQDQIDDAHDLQIQKNGLDIACERNLLLDQFKRLHNENGEIWIAELIHRCDPTWKSKWEEPR